MHWGGIETIQYKALQINCNTSWSQLKVALTHRWEVYTKWKSNAKSFIQSSSRLIYISF